MPKDYYAILGVSKTATDDEIKKAFRRLAHEHHPDKGGNAARFKDVNEAYQVLSDKQKRATYDRFGSAAFDGQAGAGAPGGGFGGFEGFDFSQFSGGFQGADFGDLGDVFGEMFGFGGGRRGPVRGRDIEMDMTLSFREAVFGVEKQIRLYRSLHCTTCKGDGAEPGTSFVTCHVCKGAGQVRQTQRTVFGTIQTAALCEVCHGKGKTAEKPCHTCRGTGVEKREQEVTVSVPAGVDADAVLKVPGEGEVAAHGGASGDLYVRLHIKADPMFVREGTDIISRLEVPFSTLVLGGRVTVETLDGPEVLDVSGGTAVGTVVSLRGKGVPHLRGKGRGNHRVELTTHIPKKLTREQKHLLDELKKMGL